MARKPMWNLAGTLPQEHGLEGIRPSLAKTPRQRHLGIIEFRNMDTGTAHPLDDPDEWRCTIIIDRLEVPTGTADQDQLAVMLRRAAEARPGQAEMAYEGGDGGQASDAG